jgi:hypothetical protein
VDKKKTKKKPPGFRKAKKKIPEFIFSLGFVHTLPTPDRIIIQDLIIEKLVIGQTHYSEANVVTDLFRGKYSFFSIMQKIIVFLFFKRKGEQEA